MDCMVIEQFYPRTGVDGVDEQPVYGKEVDEYRTALGASFDDEFIFKKVMKSRGKARTWFVPGDVICHRIGLTEDRCDLLRPMRDRVYSSSKVDVSIYEAEIEEGKVNIKIMLNNPISIPEHSKFLEELDVHFGKIAEAEDKLEAIKNHFDGSQELLNEDVQMALKL